jgi:hypothetical protein
MSCGISSSFPEVFPTSGQVTHVLLTRPPLDSESCPPGLARLACVKHAASVHSEPGSNSPLKSVRAAPAPWVRGPEGPCSLESTSPFDSSKTLFSQTDLGFSTRYGTARSLAPIQNQEKTSGTLYSVFKEPDPRGPTFFARRRRRPASASCQNAPKGEPPVSPTLTRRSSAFFARLRPNGRGETRFDLRKNRRTPKGGAV